MHLSHHSVTHQQKRVSHYVGNTDSHALFNLLTSPQLLDSVEELLPEHRERLYPPTETLSMFLSQALSADELPASGQRCRGQAYDLWSRTR